MKTSKIILMLLCYGMSAQSQTKVDTTDMYFQHLKLSEVVVTGLTGDSRLKDMPAPVSIVSEADLRAVPATNIIDAISRQPGVSQITTGGAISKPVIRGLGYNRVAVISDGIRQEGQQWGDEHGIEVDAQSVGSVEIQKGPSSLMYGSDAMAGVIILHPYRILPLGQMKAGVSTGFQTNNGLFDYTVNFAGNKQGIVWDGRWSHRLAHAYQNHRDGYVPGSQFQEHAASGLVGLNRHWGHTHLKFSYFHQLPSLVEGDRDETTGRLVPHSSNVKTYGKTLPFQRINHYKAVLDNAFHLGEGTLKVLLGYQLNNRKEYEESESEAGLHFRLHTFTYDARYQLETVSDWKLAAGVQGMFQRSLNLGEEYLIPAYRLFDIGGFATASRCFGEWVVTGGLRLDNRSLSSESLLEDGEERFHDFRRNMTGLSGSIGAVWNVSEKINLRANISHGFRAPNMSELGSNGEHEGTGRYEIGNHQLSPEHSWQADLGFDLSTSFVSAQLSLFANRISNYIFLHRTAEVVQAGTPTFRYTSGTARLLGFEAMVDLHPIHHLHFENTFSFVDARQLNQPLETRYLPFTPAPRWTSELKYELTHEGARPFNNAYVALSLECYLRQDHYHMALGTETATPSYTLLNLTAGTDIRLRHRKLCTIHLALNNIFDRSYQNHLSRLKYIGTNPLTGERGICDMGRNFTVRLIVPIL